MFAGIYVVSGCRFLVDPEPDWFTVLRFPLTSYMLILIRYISRETSA